MRQRRFMPQFTRRPPMRWLAWLCLALLLAAQGVGQVHRIAHGLPAALQAADDGRHHWGHASGSLDCQVLDQLGHVDGLPCVVALPAGLPAASPVADLVPPPAALGARWARHARGPPSSLLLA